MAKQINGYTVDFGHLDRMQKRVMTEDSWVTIKQLHEERWSDKSILEYWLYLRRQCGELADLI